MSLIPTGAAQVNFKVTGLGAPLGAQFTFGVACGDETEADDVAQGALNALQFSGLWGFMSSSVTITAVLAKKGPNLTGPMAEIGANLVGGDNSEPVPPNVALLIRKNTPQGGRMNQGRLYLPGLPEAVVGASGNLSPATMAQMQTKADDFLEALQDASLPMLLLHSTETSQYLPQPVLKLSIQARVATQRRRLRG